ncbi:aminoglycoside phosphotransferase [Amycolatopsis antarctica]|uniref:Aminoglycoside phosphotransferase n=1 Tax=Amycolatopsis antarctica TaxID=1854586 RepID=A0A263CXV2_9PSEU|nr:phosphotransferase [Amycolatopsis antarctica]OZM70247.1 aminoglycoside phosphotransferase [Amycolatopsis antarctica]
MTLSVRRADPRLGWDDLPAAIRAEVEGGLRSPVVRSLRQSPEFEGAVCARLELEDGRRVYAKALPSDSPRLGNYHAERDVSRRLPSAAPVPGLLSTVDGDWLVLVFSDVDGTRPKLRPGSPDLSAVFTTLGALARTLTPCPLDGVPTAVDDLGPLLRGWTELSADPPADLDPWALRNLDSLVAMETSWYPWAAGDTLLHNDLHPGNLVVSGPGRVLVVNWRYPARGAAWLDLVSLVPHVLAAGHEPADVDRLLRRRPALHGVPLWAVTAYIVALAGHAERSSRLPEPPATSGVRAAQRALAAAGRAWIAHRTHWR